METNKVEFKNLLEKEKTEKRKNSDVGDGVENESEPKRMKLEKEKERNGNGSGSGSGNVGEETKIDALPVDVLTIIIEHVSKAQWPSLEGVDRKFREAVFGAWRNLRDVAIDEDLAVKRTNVWPKARRVLNLVLKKLLLRSPLIISLGGFSISGKNFDQDLFRDKTIQLLAEFENLERVDFSGHGISVERLANFLKTSASREQLKELVVVKSSGACDDEDFDAELDEVEEESLRAAFGSENLDLPLLKLEQLTVGDFPSAVVLAAIDASLLTTLDVCNVNIISTDLTSLINRSPKLVDLTFDLLMVAVTTSVPLLSLSKEDAQLFQAVSSKNLSRLVVNQNHDGVFGLEGELVKMIRELGRRRSLLEFHIAGKHFCTNTICLAIADNLPDLLSLGFWINDCDDFALIQLFTKLKKLETLQLDGRTRQRYEKLLGKRVISALATNLGSLEMLYLMFPASHLRNLDELGALSNLNTLRIENATVSKSAFERWSEGFGCQLETLRLPRPNEISEEGLSILIENAPCLIKLDVAGSNISDDTLSVVSESCPFLVDLYLDDCKNITSAGVQEVIDGCQRLKRLKIEDIDDLEIEKYRMIDFE